MLIEFRTTTTVSEPSHRSLVSPSRKLAPALLTLLAFEQPAAQRAVASLVLAPYERCGGEPEFALEVASLRLPDAATGGALLRHACREVDALRAGAALLARPSTAEDARELSMLGFVPTDGDEARPLEGQRLAFAARREARDEVGASNAAVHVADVERSIDFWSLLLFEPTRRFTTQGARAAWLSAPWCSLCLELIEVPPLLRGAPCSTGRPTGAAAADPGLDWAQLGLAHVSLDLTPLGLSLVPTLALLQARSERRFGRSLRVLAPPRQQMWGDLVAEVRASSRLPPPPPCDARAPAHYTGHARRGARGYTH